MMGKILILPFVIFWLVLACVGILLEFILTFWMKEPINFWLKTSKELINIYRE